MLDPMRLARPGGDETQLLLGSAGFAGRMLRPRRRMAGIALRIGADIFVRNLRVGGRHGVAARIGRGVGIALVRRVRVGDIQTGRGGAGPRLLVMPVLLGEGFRPAVRPRGRSPRRTDAAADWPEHRGGCSGVSWACGPPVVEVTRARDEGSGWDMAVRSQYRAGLAPHPSFATARAVLAALPSPQRGRVRRRNFGRAKASIGSFDWLRTGLRLRGGRYGPRDAKRLGAIYTETHRVPRRRAFRTGRPVAGIDRRQPSAPQVSGTAPKPSRLSCPLPAVRSTPYPSRADGGRIRPPEAPGISFCKLRAGD